MEGFKPKTEEELAKQTAEVEKNINQNFDEYTSLIPEGEDVFSMSHEELASKYSRRYQIYIDQLRKSKNEPSEEQEKEELEKQYSIIKALNNLKSYLEAHRKGGTEKLALKERQIETLQKVSDWLEAGGEKGYVVMPTGVGKTVIFLSLVEAMGLKTFICEPTQILQNQVIDEIADKTAIEETDVTRRGRTKNISGNIVVTTYASLLNDVKDARLKENEVDLFIRDEVHKVLVKTLKLHLIYCQVFKLVLLPLKTMNTNL